MVGGYPLLHCQSGRFSQLLWLFVAGFSMLCLFCINWIPGFDYTYEATSIHSSHVIGFHAAFGIFSYGILALSSLLSIMYLIQFHGLMSRKVSGFFSILPPLVQLEKLQLAFWGLGIFTLSISLIVGTIALLSEVVAVPHSKLLAASIVWLLGLLILILKSLNKLYANRFAWSVIIAFLLALMTLVPIDQARHSEDSPGAVETNPS
jgi:ABC-type uncharacterized transport system permease subunit